MSNSTFSIDITLSDSVNELNRLRTALKNSTENTTQLAAAIKTADAAVKQAETSFMKQSTTLATIGRNFDVAGGAIMRFQAETKKAKLATTELVKKNLEIVNSFVGYHAARVPVEKMNAAYQRMIVLQGEVNAAKHAGVAIITKEVALLEVEAALATTTNSMVTKQLQLENLLRSGVSKKIMEQTAAVLGLTAAYNAQRVVSAKEAVLTAAVTAAKTAQIKQLQLEALVRANLSKTLHAQTAASLGLATSSQLNVAATGKAAVAAKGASQAFTNMGSAIRGVAGSFGLLWMSYGRIIPLMAAFAGAAVIKNIYSLGAGFEYTARYVEMLGKYSGNASLTVAKMREELMKVTDTRHGINDLAMGMKELAKAGVSTEVALENIGELSRFASIAEMELADSTKLVIGQSNAFGISYAAAANKISAAALSSATDIKEMATAMSHTTELGSIAGVTFDEVATSLGVLANAGIKGSKAGTALRTSILRMQTPTVKLGKMFKELGIEWSAFTEAGANKTVLQMFKELDEVTRDLTDQQRVRLMREIFGLRAIKGGANIIASLSGSFEDMYRKVQQATVGMTFLERAYEELSNTATVRLDEVQAAFVNTMISAYDTSPAILGLLDSLEAIAESESFGRFLTRTIEGLGNIAAAAVITTAAFIKLRDAFDDFANLEIPSLWGGSNRVGDSAPFGFDLFKNLQSGDLSSAWLEFLGYFKSAEELSSSLTGETSLLTKFLHLNVVALKKTEEGYEGATKAAKNYILETNVERTAALKSQAALAEAIQWQKVPQPTIIPVSDSYKVTKDGIKEVAVQSYALESALEKVAVKMRALKEHAGSPFQTMLESLETAGDKVSSFEEKLRSLKKEEQLNADEIRIVQKELENYNQALEDSAKQIFIEKRDKAILKMNEQIDKLAYKSSKTLPEIAKGFMQIDSATEGGIKNIERQKIALLGMDDGTKAYANALAYVNKNLTHTNEELREIAELNKEAFRAKLIKEWDTQFQSVVDKYSIVNKHQKRLNTLNNEFDKQLVSINNKFGEGTKEYGERKKKIEEMRAYALATDTELLKSSNNLWNGVKAGIIEAHTELATFGELGHTIFGELKEGIKGTFVALMSNEASEIDSIWTTTWENIRDSAIDHFAEIATVWTMDTAFKGLDSLTGGLLSGLGLTSGTSPTGQPGDPLYVVPVTGGLSGGAGGGIFGLLGKGFEKLFGTTFSGAIGSGLEKIATSVTGSALWQGISSIGSGSGILGTGGGFLGSSVTNLGAEGFVPGLPYLGAGQSAAGMGELGALGAEGYVGAGGAKSGLMGAGAYAGPAIAAVVGAAVVAGFVDHWSQASFDEELKAAGLTGKQFLGAFSDQLAPINAEISKAVPYMGAWARAMADQNEQTLVMTRAASGFNNEMTIGAMRFNELTGEFNSVSHLVLSAETNIKYMAEASGMLNASMIETAAAQAGVASSTQALVEKYLGAGAAADYLAGNIGKASGEMASAADASAAAIQKYINGLGVANVTLAQSAKMYQNVSLAASGSSDASLRLVSQLRSIGFSGAEAARAASYLAGNIDRLRGAEQGAGSAAQDAAQRVNSFGHSMGGAASAASSAAGGISSAAARIRSSWRELNRRQASDEHAMGGMIPVGTRGFATGGFLSGGSGVRDDLYLGTIGGTAYLAKGGEFIVNPEDTAKNRAQLERINKGMGGDGSGATVIVEPVFHISIDGSDIINDKELNYTIEKVSEDIRIKADRRGVSGIKTTYAGH